MAGGMGSRYGGLKQVDSFGPNNESILDYSIYDAIGAGFSKIVILSSPKLEKYFKEKYIDLFDSIYNCDLNIVVQDPHYGLGEHDIPIKREKPWGTGHAVLCCEQVIDNSFSIINADDFYGSDALKKILKSLKFIENNNIQASIISYLIENTLSDFGGVSRGVCKSKNSLLKSIEETHEMIKLGDMVIGKYNGDVKKYPYGTEVAMNLIGFQKSIFKKLNNDFSTFLSENLNDPKKEFLIPDVVNDLIDQKVYINKTNEEWFGVTYPEDKKFVKNKIKKLIESGKYSTPIWNQLNG